MKNKTGLVVLLAGLIATGAWADPEMGKEKGKAKEPVHGQPESADIAVKVNGMVCSFCAQGITKKLTALPQVEKVDVRMSDSRVYITTRKGEQLDDKVIQNLLTEAGYTVEKIDRVRKPA